ncbi:hypothetical protein HKX48_003357 [Thoreauomyces humboldtii]|nr:hypothetical protein HKX48_003357 [Thoreauomyces humboldtii]
MASSFATNVAQLVVLQGVIGGVTAAVIYMPVILYLQEWFVERRGTASGIIFAGTGLGGACLPYVISYLLETFGFAWATRIWVIVSFLSLGPAAYAIRPRLPVVKPAPDTPFAPVDVSSLSLKAVLPSLLAAFFAGLSWFPVSVMIPTFTSSIGGSALSSNIVLSLLNIANTIGGVIFGWFSDRVGYSWLFVILGMGEGLAALASWGTASTLSAVMGFVVIFGLLNGQTSIWNGCARDLTRANPANAALVFSAMGSCRGVACIAGPLVAAVLYEPSLSGDSSSWGRFGFKHIMFWLPAVFTGVGGVQTEAGSPAMTNQNVLSRAFAELVEDVTKFAAAVDWTEPFIRGVLTFHVVLFAWIIGTRNNHTITSINFIAVGLSIILMKTINSIAAQHYTSFSRINYFDSHGIFMGLLWAAPLLVDLAIIVGLLLRQSAQMLVKLKTRELEIKKAKSNPNSVPSSTSGNARQPRVIDDSKVIHAQPPPVVIEQPFILQGITWVLGVFGGAETNCAKPVKRPPGPVDRNRFPAHVAVSFRGKSPPRLGDIIQVCMWCREHGVKVLTVHDANGMRSDE